MKIAKKTTFTEKYLKKYRPFFWSFGNTTHQQEQNEVLKPLFVVDDSK